MYNIIFVFLTVNFALINAEVGNSFTNKVIDELKDYRILEIIQDVIKNVEDSTTNIRENEKILQAKIDNLMQNLVEKRKTIQRYVRCKSEQQNAESYHGFLKEIEGSTAFMILTSFHDFSTLQNCLKEQRKIPENMKSNNNEEKCNKFKTFPEKDIKELDDLIVKKYVNKKSLNNGLFIYDFAARNFDKLISLAKKYNAILPF
ncbi:unnamed protein product [Schistosoma margrebowiei]|uniref:Uncharacterized protein n=1 Tax=Schistosoma margrebowiei TaxID=48269 RepID=A0AA85AL20_9TREM|nr:unnamed protein product [Schistosoma margrebowiei]